MDTTKDKPSSTEPKLPSLIIWVRESPFVFGLLPLCSKVGVKVLSKVAGYCAAKEGYSPHLSLQQWAHISKYKLQIPIELSWNYLRIFDILSKPVDIQHNLKYKDAWDHKVEEIRSASDAHDEISVDTLRFLLFLFIQNFPRLGKNNKNSKSKEFEEIWPANNKSTKAIVPKRKVQEQLQFEFMLNNLTEVIDFLISALQENEKQIEGKIPLKIVRSLDLLLGSASIEAGVEFSSLEHCLKEQGQGSQLGLDIEMLDKEKFISWIRMNLKLNPWGSSSAPVPQVVLESISGSWSPSNAKSPRVYWNTQPSPKGWILISGLCSQVLYLDAVAKTSPLVSLRLHRIVDSFLYIPGPLGAVLVEKCVNTTICLGPAVSFVKFMDCSGLKFSGAGRNFQMVECNSSTFSILTPTQPLIWGKGSRGIVIGPYNTTYPGLDQDMDMVGLGTRVQKWGKPLELDSHGFPQTSKSNSSVEIMKPEQFSKLIFPFELNEKSNLKNLPLPRAFQKKVENEEKAVTELKQKIGSLSSEKKNEIKKIINKRFFDWLKVNEESALNQLKGLRAMQKSIGANQEQNLNHNNPEFELEAELLNVIS